MLPADGRVQDDASEPEPDALASGWVTPPGGTKVDALFVLAGSSLGIGRTERVTSPVWLNLEELVTLDAIGEPDDGVTEVELSMEDGTTIGAGWTDAFCSSVVDALTVIAAARSGAPTLDSPVVDAPLVDAPAAVDAPDADASTADGPTADGSMSDEPAPEVSAPDTSDPTTVPTFGVGAAPSTESVPSPVAEIADAADATTDRPDVRFDEVVAPQETPARQSAPSRSASLELEDVVYIGGYPGQSKRRKKCTTTLTRAGLELSGPGDLSFRISWDVVKTLEVQNSDEARFRMNTKIHRDASALVVECEQGVTILLEARDCPTVALRSAIGQLMVDLPVVVVSGPVDDHIVLVGLSGSGKSTVAPLLASRSGRNVVIDLDRSIEARVGRPVHEIFETEGEAAFRTLETDALSDALTGPPAIIATGGGVVMAAENRSQLRTRATVIWLRAHPSHLADRLADTSEARPLLDGDAEFALQRLSSEREALYAEVADIVVDVDGVDAVSVAEELMELLARHTS